jgi:hypothetical protein
MPTINLVSDWYKAALDQFGRGNKVVDASNIETVDVDPNAPKHFQTRIKKFKKDDNYGPRTQDFINRTQSFLDAAKRVATKSDTHSSFKLKKLDDIQASIADDITSRCSISNENIRLMKDANHKKLLLQALTGQFKQYNQYMDELMTKVLGLLSDDPDPVMIKAIRDQINHEEKQLIAEMARPSILHQYPIPGSITTEEHKFISAHQVQGSLTAEQLSKKTAWDKATNSAYGYQASKNDPNGTNPSSVRNTEGLPNFLRATFVDDDKQKILFEGYRHSSPTPIRIHDRIRRQAMAYRNVQQLIHQVARNKLADDKTNSDGPISVDIASMSLLSNDWIEWFRGCENETEQIRESVMALRTYNHRELNMEIDGKNHVIHVQTNSMTMGCNSLRNIRIRLFDSGIEDKINQRGFVNHMEKMRQHLCDFLRRPGNARNLATQLENQTLNTNSSLYRDYQTKLKAAYIELEKRANQYEVSAAAKDDTIADKKTAYDAKHKEITKLESQLDKFYSDALTTQKKLWLELKKDLFEQLKTINDLAEKNDEDIKFANILSLFCDLNALYFEKDGSYRNYAIDDYYFQFHARFLISAHLTGQSADFFCKSGEDRTGRINNVIEELLAYAKINGGLLPRYDDEEAQQMINDAISPYVHDYSASRETTHYNAHGSRGLQIAKGQGSDHLCTAELDRTMATTAKRIYERSLNYKEITKQCHSNAETKSHHASSSQLYSPTESPNTPPSVNCNSLHTAAQISAALNDFNLNKTDEQFSDYLLLIHSATVNGNTTDIKKELSRLLTQTQSVSIHNPWLERTRILLELKQQLMDQSNKIDQNSLSLDIQPDNGTIAPIKHQLKRLQTKSFLKLEAKFRAIDGWLKNESSVNPVQQLSEKSFAFTWNFPFFTWKNRTLDNEKIATKLAITSSRTQIRRTEDIKKAMKVVITDLQKILTDSTSQKRILPHNRIPEEIEKSIKEASQLTDLDTLEHEISTLKKQNDTIIQIKPDLLKTRIALNKYHAAFCRLDEVNKMLMPSSADVNVAIVTSSTAEIEHLTTIVKAEIPNDTISTLQRSVESRKSAIKQKQQEEKIHPVTPEVHSLSKIIEEHSLKLATFSLIASATMSITIGCSFLAMMQMSMIAQAVTYHSSNVIDHLTTNGLFGPNKATCSPAARGNQPAFAL